jgi:hypothetical protein
MPRLKRMAAERTAKAVIRHSAHGFVAKLRRKPLRSATLLGAGVGVGVLGGLIAGRRRAPAAS